MVSFSLAFDLLKQKLPVIGESVPAYISCHGYNSNVARDSVKRFDEKSLGFSKWQEQAT